LQDAVLTEMTGDENEDGLWERAQAKSYPLKIRIYALSSTE